MPHPSRSRNSLLRNTTASVNRNARTSSARPAPSRFAQKAPAIAPPRKAARFKHKHVRGKNIQEVVREQQRNRGTVTQLQEMQKQFWGLTDDAMDAVRRALRVSTDGKFAYKILCAAGVIPTPEEISALKQPKQVASDLNESDPVRMQYLRLCSHAYDISKAYKLPLITDENSEKHESESP